MQEPAAQIPAEEENIKRPDFRPQEIPKEMHRIVVTDGDEPDWMVSANRVSGAAERRGAPAGKGVQPEEKTEKSAAAKPVRTHAAAAEKPKASKPRAAAPKKAQAAAARKSVRPAPRKMSKKAIARRNAQIRRTMLGGIAAVALIALIVAGGMGMGRLVDIKKTLDQGKDVFYHNIFVNDIPLEGKTLDEARAIVTQQVSSLVSAWRITGSSLSAFTCS